jgi:formate hydrogenlyase subunit 3/multisubunit Na+/H+ antiporter MnhD subunit
MYHLASATGAAGGLFAGLLGIVFLVIVIAVALGLYWSPTLTAMWFRRKGKPVDRKIDVMGSPVNQMTLIAVLNLFGFIVLPWWAAWVALLYKRQPTVVVNNPGPGQQYPQYPVYSGQPQAEHEAGQWPSEPQSGATPAPAADTDRGPSND